MAEFSKTRPTAAPSSTRPERTRAHTYVIPRNDPDCKFRSYRISRKRVGGNRPSGITARRTFTGNGRTVIVVIFVNAGPPSPQLRSLFGRAMLIRRGVRGSLESRRISMDRSKFCRTVFHGQFEIAGPGCRTALGITPSDFQTTRP